MIGRCRTHGAGARGQLAARGRGSSGAPSRSAGSRRPARRLASPQLRATRLMLSVVPYVKMTSSRAAASMKRLHLLAGLLVQIGALVAQPVDAAMHVGVVLLVGVDDRLNHLPRPLRGGGVVEIHQRHAGHDRPSRAAWWKESGNRQRMRSTSNVGRGGGCHGDLMPRSGSSASPASGRIDGRLQHPPGQQAALLPVGRQLGAEQFEHVLGRERLTSSTGRPSIRSISIEAAAWLMQQPSPLK